MRIAQKSVEAIIVLVLDLCIVALTGVAIALFVLQFSGGG